MFVDTTKEMDNTQNEIPKEQVAMIQQVVSGETRKEKDPKRVAAGKRLAEHNRQKRLGLLESNSLSSQLSSIPNLVSVATLALTAYTIFGNRQPTLPRRNSRDGYME